MVGADRLNQFKLRLANRYLVGSQFRNFILVRREPFKSIVYEERNAT